MPKAEKGRNTPHKPVSKMKKILIIAFISISNLLFAQDVFYHTSNQDIYTFLDEFANLGLIQLNTTIKPYSRTFIAQKLNEIENSNYHLNKRQKAELAFYLKDFNKELKPSYTRKNKTFDKLQETFLVL